MTITKPTLKWVPIHHWHKVGLSGFTHVRGVFQFLLDDETMFVGCAAGHNANLGNRIVAYRSPKGTGQHHYAGRLIYEHRAELKLQIAVFDLPEKQIAQLATDLIIELRPPWNVPMAKHQV